MDSNGTMEESTVPNGKKAEDEERTDDVRINEHLDFASLLLSPAVIKGLQNAGLERPSPIQLQAIPVGRCGLDLVVQAKSGTGKTAVFTVIALESLVISNVSPQVLIIAPTREIADQITSVVKTLGKFVSGLKVGCFIGGMGLKIDQSKAKSCHIIIGSPGRICQLVKEGHLSLDSIRLFVLDEADKLIDDAQEPINWIFSQLPQSKQMIVTSATYPKALDQLLSQYMRSPTMIQLNSEDVQLIGIKQFLVNIDDFIKSGKISTPKPIEAKLEFLVRFFASVGFTQCLVFCNFLDRVEEVCRHLESHKWPTKFISANLLQKDRLQVMRQLKNLDYRILVSTDLTARGIDAEKVNLVINFDIPNDAETYFHRIGRAGRYGGYGAAVTLATKQELKRFRLMAKLNNFKLKLLPDPIPDHLVTSEESWKNAIAPDFDKFQPSQSAKLVKELPDFENGFEFETEFQSIEPSRPYPRDELIHFSQTTASAFLPQNLAEKLKEWEILRKAPKTEKKKVPNGISIASNFNSANLKNNEKKLISNESKVGDTVYSSEKLLEIGRQAYDNNLILNRIPKEIFVLDSKGNKNVLTNGDQRESHEDSKEKKNSGEITEPGWVFVGNMPFQVRKGQLEKEFAAFGRITEIKFVPNKIHPEKPSGCAFVCFASNESARTAVEVMRGQKLKGRPIRVEIADLTKMEQSFQKHKAKIVPPQSESQSGNGKNSLQSDQTPCSDLKTEPVKEENEIEVGAVPPGFEAKSENVTKVRVLPRKEPQPEINTLGIPNDFPELVEKAKKFLHESKADFHRRITVKLAGQPPVIIEPEIKKPATAEIAAQTAAYHLTKDSTETQTDPVLVFNGNVDAGKNKPEPDAVFRKAEPEPDAIAQSTSNPSAAWEGYERYWQMYYQQMPIDESEQWYNNRMTQYRQMAEVNDYFDRMFNNEPEH